MDTQPLSMFSGETREREMEGESGQLDDLFLQLDDPFSVQGNTQSSQCSKLDDSLTKLDDPLTKLDDTLTKLDGPVTELDDPFSVSQDTNPTTTSQTSKQDDRITGLDDQIAELDDPFDDVESEVEEQMVPESPSSSCAPQNCLEKEEGGREGEMEEDTQTRKVPRRRFRGRHNRQYNLELLPHQFRRPTLAPSRGRRGRRGRQRVNWANRVSVCEERETASLETGAGVGGKALSVFEVPLSVGEEGGGRRGEEEGGRGGRDQEVVRENRSNLSVSGLDLSSISRTRDQQVRIYTITIYTCYQLLYYGIYRRKIAYIHICLH